MSPGERSPEAVAITALLALVRQRWGAGYILRRVRYEIQGPDGLPQAVFLDPARLVLEMAARAAAEAAQPEDGRGVDRAILQTLRGAEKPLKGRALAARAGVNFNAYFWARLSHLQETRKVRKVGGGYWLCERADPS